MSVILGLNFGHDGSVCIIKNGKLISAIATERITKIKKQSGFNGDVIDYILSSSNTLIDEIDYIATNDFKQEVFGNQNQLVFHMKINPSLYLPYVMQDLIQVFL